MARLRYNGLVTTLGSNLASTDAVITFSAALTHSGTVAVPDLVAPDYIPLAVLDSSGVGTEILHLTAYTSGALTGTVDRGQEGSAAMDHLSGSKVINGPTVLDITSLETYADNGDASTLQSAESYTDTQIAAIPPPPVTSVNGQTGAVVVSAPSSIGDLGDVDTTTTAPVSGDSLMYNGTKWVPEKAGGGVYVGATQPTDTTAYPIWVKTS